MRYRFLLLFFLASLTGLGACGTETDDASAPVVVYSGRSQSLVEPLFGAWQDRTGTAVEVKYGDTAQLAVALAEEGAQSRADVFWAQDAGALGAAHAAGLLMPLPDSILARVPARYRNDAGTWVATSGRARTLAYAPARVDTTALPTSIFDLTDEAYRGRVGWAPTNGSFQAFVTSMRKQVGDDSTLAWLRAMDANGAKAYPKNSAIVQAIADGEVDFGLPNHYYLLRFKAEDADFPVEQTYFAAGDVGNLVNVAGVGVLASAPHPEAALRLVSHLLSAEAQGYFASDTHEYPVVEGIDAGAELPARDDLDALAPQVDLDALRDLEATLDLLREAGLL